MSIIAIAAVDANWGIGYNGELLEQIPADMKFFKENTTGNIVVMGRKTQDSLPKKYLPNRLNFVVTNNQNKINMDDIIYGTLEDIKTLFKNVAVLEAGRQVLEVENEIPAVKDIYIIGGASIYEQLLPYCDKAYITKIYKSHKNVDSYFPNLDKMEEEWQLIEESSPVNHKDFYYSFTTYVRI